MIGDVAIVCDTISSNTVHLTAAYIALQQKHEKHLLWVMCRPHLAEVVVSHVYVFMIWIHCHQFYSSFTAHSFKMFVITTIFPHDDYKELLDLV